MKPIHPTQNLIKRLAPALAAWAVGKVLESPRVRARIAKLDDRVFLARRKVFRKASRNRVWLAAGASAVAVGIGLLAAAAKK